MSETEHCGVHACDRGAVYRVDSAKSWYAMCAQHAGDFVRDIDDGGVYGVRPLRADRRPVMGVTPSPGPGALLDRLEEARKAATPGPWTVGRSAGTGTGIYDADGDPCGSAGLAADAALIVAAVNALPDLLRLARDGLALRADGRNPQVCPRCGNWCVYDGWDHVHGNGLGIGSCAVVVDTSGEA